MIGQRWPVPIVLSRPVGPYPSLRFLRNLLGIIGCWKPIALSRRRWAPPYRRTRYSPSIRDFRKPLLGVVGPVKSDSPSSHRPGGVSHDTRITLLGIDGIRNPIPRVATVSVA